MKVEHKEQLQKVLDALKGKTIKNFFFVGCGGSKAALGPGDYFIDRELDIPSKVYTANEFIHLNPKTLDGNSVVITRSHSGTTPETVDATNFAREKGAMTIAISMDIESPLCKAAEYVIHYNYKDGSDAVDGDVGMYWALIFSIINQISPKEQYGRILNQLSNLEKLLEVNKKESFDAAYEFGKKYKRENLIYTMASGAYMDQAYSFTSCLLMEMLWIHSNAIHAGEFFHGPFEITDYDTPFLVIMGEGASRPIDQRALDFVKKFSDNVEVIDVQKLNYLKIDDDLKEYFGPAIVGAVLRQYADGLAEHTGHPLSVRRYMWKMEY